MLLPSTANITWKIANNEGRLGPDDQISIEFSSKSTAAEASGIGWLPVRVPVQAFDPAAGTQVWQVGSGILRSRLDAGAGTEGAGIVILHGNKMANTGMGAEQDWVWEWEYVLDLANAAPGPVAKMWTYTAPGGGNAGIYTLTGEMVRTKVRVIGETNTNRIAVAAGAEVTVVLDAMKIDLHTGDSPFELGAGSKVTLYLNNDNTLESYRSSYNSAGLQTTGAEPGIGSGYADMTDGWAGGIITVEDGDITAYSTEAAGIGSGGVNDNLGDGGVGADPGWYLYQ